MEAQAVYDSIKAEGERLEKTMGWAKAAALYLEGAQRMISKEHAVTLFLKAAACFEASAFNAPNEREFSLAISEAISACSKAEELGSSAATVNSFSVLPRVHGLRLRTFLSSSVEERSCSTKL